MTLHICRVVQHKYMVAFDVEVLPTSNNYRTHKTINEIDLILVDSADVAPTATAPENRTGLSTHIIPRAESEANTISEGI